ncbi:MAG: hypothetical protein NTW21_30700 [Verrucomicrobia bacterium]|nr:hypothetical protein [Verrucomicrobiota bacterium]
MPTSDSKLMTTATQKPPATHPAAGENPPVRIEVELPLLTIVKGFGALLGAYVVCGLWPLLLVVFLALFLAVTLHAFVAWLDSRRMKHWFSRPSPHRANPRQCPAKSRPSPHRANPRRHPAKSSPNPRRMSLRANHRYRATRVQANPTKKIARRMEKITCTNLKPTTNQHPKL